MQDDSNQTKSSQAAVEEGGSRIDDLAIVIFRYRVLVIGVSISVVLLTFVMTILTPKRFEATASILAREGSGGIISALASTTLQQIPGLSVPSLTPNRDMMLGILKSRTLARNAVDRFRLKEHYRAKLIEDAVKIVTANTRVNSSREGVVSVTVEDTDPHLAAEMANFYLDQLDRRVSQLGSGEAGRLRGFISEQLTRAKGELEVTDQTFRRVQERNRAVVLPEQMRGAIDAAGRLKGEIIAAEVQLQVLRNFATEANPDVLAVNRRVVEMKRQLAQMEYGDGGVSSERGDFHVPFARVPQVGLDLARLTREVKVQETVVALLTQQLEQAKIAEAKDIPVVMVLDRAMPPERATKPRRILNMAIAALVGPVAGIFLAFLTDSGRRGLRRLQKR